MEKKYTTIKSMEKTSNPAGIWLAGGIKQRDQIIKNTLGMKVLVDGITETNDEYMCDGKAAEYFSEAWKNINDSSKWLSLIKQAASTARLAGTDNDLTDRWVIYQLERYKMETGQFFNLANLK